MDGNSGVEVPKVRSADVFDLPFVAEIDRISDSPAWSVSAFRESLSSNDVFLRLAVVRDNIVAFCCFRIIGTEMEILKLAVVPEYRRRGIGRQILSDAIGCFDSSGEKKIYLEVRSHNRAAIALYESRGFVRSGVRKRYYADPLDDAQVMVLSLGAKRP